MTDAVPDTAPEPPAVPVLELRGVTVRYGSVTALSRVSAAAPGCAVSGRATTSALTPFG